MQNPLFVTAQHCIEHKKIENKTKEEILLKIKDLLLTMPDKEIANGESKELEELEKNEEKNSWINFYYDIKEMMEEQTAAMFLNILQNSLENTYAGVYFS